MGLNEENYFSKAEPLDTDSFLWNGGAPWGTGTVHIVTFLFSVPTKTILFFAPTPTRTGGTSFSLTPYGRYNPIRGVTHRFCAIFLSRRVFISGRSHPFLLSMSRLNKEQARQMLGDLCEQTYDTSIPTVLSLLCR